MSELRNGRNEDSFLRMKSTTVRSWCEVATVRFYMVWARAAAKRPTIVTANVEASTTPSVRV